MLSPLFYFAFIFVIAFAKAEDDAQPPDVVTGQYDNLEDVIYDLQKSMESREMIQKQLEGGFTMQFEDGLVEEEKDAIVELLTGMHHNQISEGHRRGRQLRRAGGYERRLSCSAQTACYIASCWVPIVGAACLACMAIDCP